MTIDEATKEYVADYKRLPDVTRKAFVSVFTSGLLAGKDPSNDLIAHLTALKLAEDSANAGR